MPRSALEQWLDLAPKPWPLGTGQKWHAYLSYRSIHRQWVLQLYDILKGLGYALFIDRYVLTPGTDLMRSMEEAIAQSAAGVLVFGSTTEDSDWTKREFQMFGALSQKNPGFRFVTVTIDKTPLPAYVYASQNSLIDFSEFREGPNGTPLLQLLYALQREPMPAEAVRLATEVDEEARSSLALIRAAGSVGRTETLVELAQKDTLAWRTSPALLCQVIGALISLHEYQRALEVAEQCRRIFPRAIRPQQLQALALARIGKWQEAQLILTTLYESGERDAETLGILARTWMDRYRAEKNVNFLRRSRDLYLEAFRTDPDDFYAGVNAASKSAMLGELEEAAQYAKQVEERLGSEAIPRDYWRTVTVAEIRLLQRDFAGAGGLYQEAVGQDPAAIGSQESSYQQALLLLDSLGASPQDRLVVLAAFEHLSRAAAAEQGPAFQPQPADRAMVAKLLFSLVARRHVEPGLLNSLDAAKFRDAVHKVRPDATRNEWPALAAELGGAEGGNPRPLWLAWLETVRSRDLDKLLQ